VTGREKRSLSDGKKKQLEIVAQKEKMLSTTKKRDVLEKEADSHGKSILARGKEKTENAFPGGGAIRGPRTWGVGREKGKLSSHFRRVNLDKGSRALGREGLSRGDRAALSIASRARGKKAPAPPIRKSPTAELLKIII